MLVSERHRFVFVHVQKTAGTSLTSALAVHALNPSASRWNKLASDLGLRRDWRRMLLRKHANLRRAQQVLPEDFYRVACKFAFVRNPWDRLVSWYRYVQATPSHADRRPGETFEVFARRFLSKERRTQWWMITDAQGRMGLDYVGRFETLGDDVAELGRMLQLPSLVLPRSDSAKRHDYRTYFDDALAEEVQRTCAQEIEAFGYRFD